MWTSSKTARVACGLLVTLVVWLAPRMARADALVVGDRDVAGQTLGLLVDVLEDKAGADTLAEVQAAPLSHRFIRSRVSSPGFGLTTSAYWFRFDVQNRAAEPARWILELSYPPLDDVRLFVPAAGGFALRQTGDHFPFGSRDIKHRNFLFDLEQQPGVGTYYLRVQTTGSLSVPLRAWSPKAFIEHMSNEEPPIWLFYGVMLAMAAYNLFIYASVREAAYLYYVCYIVSYIGLQFSLNGLALQFLWPTLIWWNGKALLTCLYGGFGFGLLFQREFLGLRGAFPRFDRVSTAMSWVTLGLGVAALALPYAIGIRVFVIWAVVVVLFIVVVTGFSAATRSRSAIFYTLSWFSLLLGIVFFLLRTIGVVHDSFLSVWAPQLGAAIEVLLLSLGLADRINVMRGDLQGLNAQLTGSVSQLTDALELAKAATRAKGEFVASVSHELRTPLNAIVNIPDGLLEDFREVSALACDRCEAVFGLDPEEQVDLEQACPECHVRGGLRPRSTWTYEGNPDETVRHLGTIVKASQHLLGVVSSILDFSKLEADRMELQVTVVELGAVLEDATSTMKALARARGVGLVLVPAPGDCAVRGDPVRIAQVVVNLVGNAIKFSEGRGEVCVWMDPQPDSCVIHVRDQGIGIAPADQPRLFSSFTQVDSSNTRKFGGTGLGLSISKQLVELHDGAIWFESQLGEGSTFSVRLPRSGPKRPRRDSEPLASPSIPAPASAPMASP